MPEKVGPVIHLPDVPGADAMRSDVLTLNIALKRQEIMQAVDNKRLMQNIFSELSEGNLGPLVEAMAEDVQWTWMGTMPWSKTFKGKESVVGELLGAVKATLAEPFRVMAHHFIAEGDYVVVEARGQNATPDGRTYNNRYCWVCRISGGKLREIREYMDTELVTATFHIDGKS